MKKQAVLTIGTFDGVHLGHRKVLGALKKMAEACSCEAVVLALARPARSIIKNNLHNLLTPWGEKVRILKSLGIGRVVKINFDEHLRHSAPENFFYENLLKNFNVKGLVVGWDFKFGRNKKGNRNTLKRLCRAEHIKFKAIRKLKKNRRVISSSRIRELLEEGDIPQVNKLLGYEYKISGLVCRGLGLGSKLGAPTLNLKTDETKILPSGIFVSRFLYGSKIYPGICNRTWDSTNDAALFLPQKVRTMSLHRPHFFRRKSIGLARLGPHAYCKIRVYRSVCYIGGRPTIKTANGVNVEVHITDRGWKPPAVMLSEQVSVCLLEKIRDDVKFPNLKSLSEAIQSDIKKAGLIEKKYY